MRRSNNILTINSGSSSLKFALFAVRTEEELIQSGRMERIGLEGSFFQFEDYAGKRRLKKTVTLADHNSAIKELLELLREGYPAGRLDAVGHRIVHGGGMFYNPGRITPELIKVLHDITPLAPEHLPHEIKAIEAVQKFLPGTPQVACFDTAFHHNLPAVARTYALPGNLAEKGIRRFGFHGLSYEFILEELRREDGNAGGRLVIAHLGNGASMAAVRDGKSLDTSMGLTPSGGLIMSTRCGDIDPGLMLYLMKDRGLSGDDLNKAVNEQGGLLGVSGISPDMKDLLDREKSSPEAAEAIALFCYQAMKFLGAYTAVLGGLDTLVFTGGIGENAPPIRSRICEGLSYLGIHIDRSSNQANNKIISTSESPVSVRVMKTNEELMIARHTHRQLQKEET